MTKRKTEKQHSKRVYSPSWRSQDGDFDGAEDLSKVNFTDVTSIFFVGHSSSNWFTFDSTKRTVAQYSPEGLANAIGDKFTRAGIDKTKLTDFYLIACEAGLKLGKSPSFAETFYRAMYERGFTSLKVHAMSGTKEPLVGMIVQTITMEARPGEFFINSWGYRTKQDDNKDTQLEKQKAELKKTLEKTLVPGNREAIQKEIKQIEKQQNQLRVYVCVNQPLEEAFNTPANTLGPGGSQPISGPKMSLATSVAIKCLSDKLSEEKMSKNGSRQVVLALQDLMDELYQNPDQTPQVILTRLDEGMKKEIGLFHLNHLEKYYAIKKALRISFQEQLPKPKDNPDLLSTTTVHLKRFIERFTAIIFERSDYSFFKFQLHAFQNQANHYRHSLNTGDKQEQTTALDDLKQSLNDLKQSLQEKLASYLEQHKQLQTPMHQKKLELIGQLQSFVSTIGTSKQEGEWKKIETFMQENPSWKSGFASETRLLKDEVKALQDKVDTSSWSIEKK